MPCKKCGSIIVRFGGCDVCPKCNNIHLLNRVKTTIELGRNCKEIETLLSTLLQRGFEKNKLLIALIWKREEFSRNFFSIYQPFDLHKFLSLNLLILRVTREPYFNAKMKVNYGAETSEIVETFKSIIKMKSEFLFFKEGLAEAFRPYDKISFLPNERYVPILNTFEDNDILIQSHGEEKLKEYQQILNSIIKERQPTTVKYSPETFIENFYTTINQFYCSLLRNEVYNEVFGLLKKYAEIDFTPDKLMDLVNSYQMTENKITHTSVHEFINRAKTHLGIDERRIREFLLSYDNNPNSFPLFPLVNGRVYISHRTAFLIYILMHAIIFKDLFNRETEKRSKEFELDEVRKAFESIGWTYSSNIKDKKQPTIEIDGIATHERKLLVIECKGWQLYPFYEYKNRQSYLERDTKGIIDGLKFTNEKAIKIPSLVEKIEFVKKNIGICELDPSCYDEVKGAVIMRSFPPISEYKGIKVLSVKDIQKTFDSKKSQLG